MKLIIQIPCLNEEKTLPETLRGLPTRIDGVDSIEVLVVDDGSTDRTVEVARQHGAHHVLALGTHAGLATAFRLGIERALALGADVVVNTDGDNQYPGADIPKLVAPIVAGKADLVVGCRPILEHPEFGPIKKALQLLGSWLLRRVSKTRVRDAASGFRAFSRETCRRLFIHTRFSYCMETLIQAGNTGLRVDSVDVGVNPKTRDSRLFTSVPAYLWKSGSTILAMLVLYRPGVFFLSGAGAFMGLALLLGIRFLVLVYWMHTPELGRTHLPSLIVMSLCAITGVVFVALAVLAELMRSLRRLIEETIYLQRKRPERVEP